MENENQDDQRPDSRYQPASSFEEDSGDSDYQSGVDPTQDHEISFQESGATPISLSDDESDGEEAEIATDLPTATPPWEPEQAFEAEEPPEPPKKKRNIVLMMVLGILCVAVLAATAIGWKLKSDREQIASALTATIKTMQAAEMDVDSRNQVSEAMQALESGNYSRVQEIMNDFSTAANPPTPPRLLPPGSGNLDPAGALGGRPAQGVLPPEAYNDLPESAVKYFKTHEDVLRTFLMQCDVSRTLRDRGADVDDLRDVRDAIIKAANLGQHDKVLSLLADMTKMTVQKGGPAPDMPEALIAHVKKFREVAQKAQEQRKDIRPAIGLMQQADKLALEGKTDEAAAMVQKAISNAQNAKRMQMRNPAMARGGMRPRGQMAADPRRGGSTTGRTGAMNRPNAQAGLAQVLLQNLLAMISVEEVDLSRIYHAIDNASLAAREKNGEQVKQILSPAFESFEALGKRRQEFSMMMNKIMTAAPPGQSPQQGKQGPQGKRPRADAAGAQGQERPTANADRMEHIIEMQAARAMQVLERARNLSDEEYAKRRDAIQRELVIALTPPGQSPEPQGEKPAAATQKPKPRPIDAMTNLPKYETETDRAKAEKRIRAKLQEIQGPFHKLKKSGDNPKLVNELERVFSAARLSLYAEEYIEAEVLVDEGMRLLGMDVIPLLDEKQVKKILEAVD